MLYSNRRNYEFELAVDNNKASLNKVFWVTPRSVSER